MLTWAQDRYNLSLGAAQDALVTQVAEANPNTVVVVRCPGAVLMPVSMPRARSIVQFVKKSSAEPKLCHPSLLAPSGSPR